MIGLIFHGDLTYHPSSQNQGARELPAFVFSSLSSSQNQDDYVTEWIIMCSKQNGLVQSRSYNSSAQMDQDTEILLGSDGFRRLF